MADQEYNIQVNLGGSFEQQTKKNGRAQKRFAKNTQQNLRRMRKDLAATGRSFKGFGKFAGGAGLLGAGFSSAKVSGNLLEAEERFERLGIQSGRSPAEIRQLKNQLFDTASADDINIDSKQLLDAVSEIVEKTGDLDFAREQARNMALAIQAAGAEGASVGALTAQFKKFGLTTKEEVNSALDILINQGKAGSFTLANLAQLGERNVAAYAKMGRTGIPAIREMGAALQLIRAGVGSSEQATTAFEALLRTLGDADKVKLLQEKGGIQVFDTEALKRGEEIMRPINELLVEIIQASGGKSTQLSQVFDAESTRAFSAAIAEFRQNDGAIDSINDFYNANGDGATLLADSARAAQITNQQLASTGDTVTKIADNILGTNGARDAFAAINSELSELEKRSRQEGLKGVLSQFSDVDRRLTSAIFADGLGLESFRYEGNNAAPNGDSTIRIEVSTDANSAAKVTSIETDGKTKLQVNTGRTNVGAD
jgi:hypothetical protein